MVEYQSKLKLMFEYPTVLVSNSTPWLYRAPVGVDGLLMLKRPIVLTFPLGSTVVGRAWTGGREPATGFHYKMGTAVPVVLGKSLGSYGSRRYMGLSSPEGDRRTAAKCRRWTVGYRQGVGVAE